MVPNIRVSRLGFLPSPMLELSHTWVCKHLHTSIVPGTVKTNYTSRSTIAWISIEVSEHLIPYIILISTSYKLFYISELRLRSHVCQLCTQFDWADSEWPDKPNLVGPILICLMNSTGWADSMCQQFSTIFRSMGYGCIPIGLQI